MLFCACHVSGILCGFFIAPTTLSSALRGSGFSHQWRYQRFSVLWLALYFSLPLLCFAPMYDSYASLLIQATDQRRLKKLVSLRSTSARFQRKCFFPLSANLRKIPILPWFLLPGDSLWCLLLMLCAYEAILFTWLHLYGYLLSRAGQSRFGRRSQVWLQGVTGGVLLALGAKLAFEQKV